MKHLQQVFANKILPLLEEYFYNDSVKIGMVLGSMFVKKKQNGVAFASGDWETDFDQRELYKIADPRELDAPAFRSIYESGE